MLLRKFAIWISFWHGGIIQFLSKFASLLKNVAPVGQQAPRLLVQYLFRFRSASSFLLLFCRDFDFSHCLKLPKVLCLLAHFILAAGLAAPPAPRSVRRCKFIGNPRHMRWMDSAAFFRPEDFDKIKAQTGEEVQFGHFSLGACN